MHACNIHIEQLLPLGDLFLVLVLPINTIATDDDDESAAASVGSVPPLLRGVATRDAAGTSVPPLQLLLECVCSTLSSTYGFVDGLHLRPPVAEEVAGGGGAAVAARKECSLSRTVPLLDRLGGDTDITAKASVGASRSRKIHQRRNMRWRRKREGWGMPNEEMQKRVRSREACGGRRWPGDTKGEARREVPTGMSYDCGRKNEQYIVRDKEEGSPAQRGAPSRARDAQADRQAGTVIRHTWHVGQTPPTAAAFSTSPVRKVQRNATLNCLCSVAISARRFKPFVSADEV
eukprot:GHVU01017108.1.p1 GENE.GHVU01017108.1~~GHVU01017108.1.p1  ORF type:complete len:290 (+),score=33.44 GHVU01017108.1:660-1529(+)